MNIIKNLFYIDLFNNCSENYDNDFLFKKISFHFLYFNLNIDKLKLLLFYK
jgi:hypothetical protein